MARYFFHYHNHALHADDKGVELRSDADAWTYGTRFCGELIAKLSAQMPSGQEYRLECIDGSGRGVFAVNWQATVLLQTQ